MVCDQTEANQRDWHATISPAIGPTAFPDNRICVSRARASGEGLTFRPALQPTFGSRLQIPQLAGLSCSSWISSETITGNTPSAVRTRKSAWPVIHTRLSAGGNGAAPTGAPAHLEDDRPVRAIRSQVARINETVQTRRLTCGIEQGVISGGAEKWKGL
jgi:hypothetical protein